MNESDAHLDDLVREHYESCRPRPERLAALEETLAGAADANKTRRTLFARSKQTAVLVAACVTLSAAAGAVLALAGLYGLGGFEPATGREPAADIIATRYVLPFREGLTLNTIPHPPLVNLREGAAAHVTLAALAVAQRQPQRAEQLIREVISVGLLLIDDAPDAIDTFVGASLVDFGADALEALYRTIGRTTDAETLAWARSGLNSSTRTVLSDTGMDLAYLLGTLPSLVTDRALARGIRWEYLALVATIAPCMNPHRVVFGPGERYERWLEEARRSLVSRASDRDLLQLVERGLFGGPACPSGVGVLKWFW